MIVKYVLRYTFCATKREREFDAIEKAVKAAKDTLTNYKRWEEVRSSIEIIEKQYASTENYKRGIRLQIFGVWSFTFFGEEGLSDILKKKKEAL